MKLPPNWKLERECRRLLRDLVGLPRLGFNYLFATPYYDMFLSRKRKVWPGHIGWSNRVVVYVIFPEQGFVESHLLALRQFETTGYSTVVVSNLPLSEESRAKVLAHCSRYIERPNYGYDFGAYREGVLSLSDQFTGLKRLAILNDSTWFPLPEGRNWLIDAETSALDFFGAASNYGTPRVDASDYLDLQWLYTCTHRNFHYSSFALSFGERFLADPEFQRFWKSLRMEKNKRKVVRRGEIGISQWVIAHGYTHGCMLELKGLPDLLANLSDKRLGCLAKNIVVLEDQRLIALKTELTALPTSSPEWRHKLTQFILCSVSKQGAGYALSDLAIKELGYPFLKKSPMKLSQDGAESTLRLLDELGLGPDDPILREARDLYGTR